MPALNTWINPAIDSGERFAEALVEPLEAAEDGQNVGVEVDDEPIQFSEYYESETVYRRMATIRRVIAAAWEAGREFGHKEPR